MDNSKLVASTFLTFHDHGGEHIPDSQKSYELISWTNALKLCRSAQNNSLPVVNSRRELESLVQLYHLSPYTQAAQFLFLGLQLSIKVGNLCLCVAQFQVTFRFLFIVLQYLFAGNELLVEQKPCCLSVLERILARQVPFCLQE